MCNRVMAATGYETQMFSIQFTQKSAADSAFLQSTPACINVCDWHLSFRCGLQVTQTVAESLSSQAELAMLLLDGCHTLENHLVVLTRERSVGVTTHHKYIMKPKYHNDHTDQAF